MGGVVGAVAVGEALAAVARTGIVVDLSQNGIGATAARAGALVRLRARGAVEINLGTVLKRGAGVTGSGRVAFLLDS